MANMKLRLLNILKIFIQKTDFEHRISVPALLLELESMGIKAERKALYRDISVLTESGFEIIKSSRGYYFNNRTLSGAQIKTLISAVDSARFITPAMQKELKEKIISLASESEASMLSSYGTIASLHDDSSDLLHALDCINTAISENKKLSFLSGTLNRRLTDVITALCLNEGFFLVCRDNSNSPLELLNLNTLSDISVSSQTASKSKNIKLSTNDEIKEFICNFGAEPMTATLKCEASTYDIISEKFGKRAKFSKILGSHFTASIKAAPSDALISFLASLGSNVEVLSPESLREKMHEFLKEAQEMYCKK